MSATVDIRAAREAPSRRLDDAPHQRPDRLPLVERVHTAVPGRARLRVRTLYRAEALGRTIEQRLRAARGVRAVSASSLTATVLVHFDGACSLDEIVMTLESLALRPGADAAQRAVSSAKPAPPAQIRAGPAELDVRIPTRHDSSSWHVARIGQVLAELDTSPGGLSSTAARERLRRFGPNTLPTAQTRSPLSVFLAQFCTMPVALLGASALVSLLTGGVADAVAIAGVVLINATIGFVTESQAERTIASLTGRVKRRALVLRDGLPQDIDAREVVPGDAVLLTPGAYVPADVRLVHVRDFSVDESALTGESMPASKCAEPLDRRDAPLADRANMAYMGTFVSAGSSLGITVATGANTEIGAIQALAAEAQAPETPMQRELNRLGGQLVWLATGICATVFGLGLLRGLGLLPMLKAAISLAVAAVPEGLPTVATTTLALGVHRMRRQHALIRRLAAVETLGAVQVICLDKTGTLTANRMAVCALHVAGKPLCVSDHRITGLSPAAGPGATEALTRLLEIAVLCNETRIADGSGTHLLEGSATETALVELAIDAGLAVSRLRERYPLIGTEYRAEGRNYMRTMHAAEDGGRLLAVKGNPAEVLNLCQWHLKDGELVDLSGQDRDTILRENERMAGEGLRVLGFAYARGGIGLDGPNHHLSWAGLAGIADPLREGVKSLIRQFHGAGIRTVMITGDQSATARSIGRALGLSEGRQLQILDSTQIEKLDPALLSARARRIDIFSRVSPAHKLHIIRALQESGHVVAMTGDGINDGPALKAADIGVAMGTAGTDVARSVADVVLEDDNLRTVIVAVTQGRTVHANIRKSIHFLLATNLSEIELMLASIALGLGQPLSPIQLLWINLVSDVFPGLALAVEPAEPDVLRRPPRDPKEPMIRRSDIARYGSEATFITAGAMASYGYGLMRYGFSPQAGTMAFTTLALGQLAHAYACRSDSHGLFTQQKLQRNPYLDLAIGTTVAVQLGALFIPGLRELLGVTALDPLDLAVVAGGAVLPLVANEALKSARVRGGQVEPTFAAPAWS